MRMPIGVPVVLPSNTPDRIFTRSVSRRWLTKCEVPVRRRSTSACTSASQSARPGGQPSTMHPMDGPWLSPKVVTAKSLPMVLPGMQLLRGQQKYSAAAALELQPRERQLRKRPAHGALRIARLDDEDAPRLKVAPRIAQNDPNRVESPAPGREGDPRLVPVLGGQRKKLPCADIGRVADDDIVAPAAKRAEMIGLEQTHSVREPVPMHVAARDLKRRCAQLERINARARECVRAGDRDASGAGAHVEHAPHARAVDPWRKAALARGGAH